METDTTKDTILTVYFCGTSSDIRQDFTQIGLFFEATKALDVTHDEDFKPTQIREPLASDLKMGFSGCGVTNGLLGTLFATGLDAQCNLVVKRIKQILALVGVERVILNCVGLSRGGMAILILLRKIASEKNLSTERLVVNALLFDPVPGNSITSVMVDVFSTTLTTQCLDVSMCPHLARVLAIYPHEPLPDVLLHAPIFPKYPATAIVEQDVVLGCHQAALANPFHGYMSREVLLSFCRIKSFLLEVGTKLEVYDIMPEKDALELMDELVRTYGATVPPSKALRETHAWRPTKIVVNKTGDFLNKFHAALASKSRPVPLAEQMPQYVLAIL